MNWSQYLLDLHERAKCSGQLRVVEQTIDAIMSRFPDVRHPSAGHDDDGAYHLTWAFDDAIGITFAIEVAENGLISWFFRDRPMDITEGTEGDGENSLSGEAMSYLELFTDGASK